MIVEFLEEDFDSAIYEFRVHHEDCSVENEMYFFLLWVISAMISPLFQSMKTANYSHLSDRHSETQTVLSETQTPVLSEKQTEKNVNVPLV